MALDNSRSSLSRRLTVWILLAGLLLGLPSLFYPWSWRDNAAAVYMGSTILEGGALYRDAWNIKAPGIDFFAALSILLFGKSAFSLRLLDLIWQLATAGVVAFLAIRIYRGSIVGAIAACAYLLFYFSQNFEYWAQPDGLLQLPLALSVLHLFHTQETDRFHRWTLAGVGIGIAALFKLVMGLLGVALLVAAIAQEGRASNRAVRRPAALAMGFATPLLAVALYLFWKGSLVDFLITQFVFAPEFAASELRIASWSTIIGSFLHPALLLLYGMGAASLLSFSVLPDGSNNGSTVVKVLWAWVATGLVALVLHGSFLGYHFLTIAAPLAILSSESIHCLVRKVRARRSLIPVLEVALLALALAAPAVGVSRRYRYAWEKIRGREPTEALQALGIYLRARTSPSDRIFVWGDVPVLYLYADRKAASRFLSAAFLSTPWRSVDYRSLFLEDFAAHRPVYFVLRMGRQDVLGFEALAALKRVVADEYVLEKADSTYRIYRRKTQSLNVSLPG